MFDDVNCSLTESQQGGEKRFLDSRVSLREVFHTILFYLVEDR